MPETPAEMAAAAPATAAVLRRFGQALPPMPGQEPDGMYTGATRSLNAQPSVTQPMEKARLASRLQTEVIDPEEDLYLEQLLMILEQDPEMAEYIIMLLQQQEEQGEAQADQLSSQRPLEYDTPNLGGNYSVLNAPCSSHIPPSVRYQELG